MSRFLIIFFSISIFIVFAGKAEATLLTFDDPLTPGLTLSSHMLWDLYYKDHLFCEYSLDDDYILFSTPTLINDFQMNGLPWKGSTGGGGIVGFMDIAAFDPEGTQLWSTTVDLSSYTQWDNWLTVSVETYNISKLVFYAPGNAPYYNDFWPSIDNMRINDVIPEPTTLILLGSGLLGLAGFRAKRSKRKE